MQKLLTTLAAASALALVASVAQAECNGHSVTASAPQSQEDVAMSTYDGATTPASDQVEETSIEVTSAPVCADGDKSCDPATK